ncbi:NAD(P)/FAD-dependent oxidoreductase [Pokkaliibacter sp. CJK22405]|uniref:NAD(P)/FAD-dependent oxidoreductase n=1 Tax=Pokkaliibacter sp. CJK22405 TaxID=3384615 RepID=UPI003984B2BF
MSEQKVSKRFAVIGAGIAGLVCAHALKKAGHEVVVFEKSRGVGGRLSSKRLPNSTGLDMGTTAFQASNSAFIEWLESFTEATLWRPQQALWLAGEGFRLVGGKSFWVGVPKMNAFLKELSADLDIRTSQRVIELESERRYITPITDTESLGNFDACVLAVPAEQAKVLLNQSPALQAYANAANAEPCWSLAISTRMPCYQPFDWLDLTGHSSLRRLVRVSSKPGAEHDTEVWVAQTHRRWSREHLEQTPEEVSALIIPEVAKLIGVSPAAMESLHVHRWRYAEHISSAEAPAYYDERRRVAICGDWLKGNSVEAAWQSGLYCARSILATL